MKTHSDIPMTDTDPQADAASHGSYHFLDVGGQKYGECILVRFDGITVLIDGSHQGDFEGQEGYDSVPDQLQAILGGAPPYQIDLLVVTHGHADHIGCVPELVENEVIQPTWALVTDPNLGFGRSADDSFSPIDADAADSRRVLEAALREEDASDLSDDDLQSFLDATVTVESRYHSLLKDLKSKGVKVIRYTGQPLPAALAELMRPTNLTVLGPTQNQLLFCAEQISTTNKDAEDAVAAALEQDATLDDVELYRKIVREHDEADARGNPRGSGMNCQSITLAFGAPGERVLLAGDMQFTEPGVTGADDEVSQLRRKVAEAGPFTLFKTTHHTSHNGQDEALLEELGDPPLIVHSGGLRDPSHPFPSTLKMLKSRSRGIKFARTDRNGLITVRPHLAPGRAIKISRGRLNDFTDNVKDDVSTPIAEQVVRQPIDKTRGDKTRGPQIIIVNLQPGPIDMTVGDVDIVVRSVESARSSEVEPIPPKVDSTRRLTRNVSTVPGLNLASGRSLPKLLFVTNPEKLEANIGRQEATAALAAIKAKGHPICSVSGSARNAESLVHSALSANPEVQGIVIAGGYDVVPSAIVDVLSPALREAVGDAEDHDDFLVWSDEAYGDIDGDKLAELPVSRIPDARDSTLFLTALQANGVSPTERFGVRNVRRPFSDAVWPRVTGSRPLNVSEFYLSQHIAAADVSSSCHYFMLHGRDQDARFFEGESTAGGGLLAFSVANVPKKFNGMVFTGCCWGALTVSQKALNASEGLVAPRVPERSIALSYLKAGANAFVGCTGSHYSGPDTDPDINYALRFHDSFWDLLPKMQFQSAPTLFRARTDYARWISSLGAGQEPLHLARRLKNRAQFTCLGLGW